MTNLDSGQTHEELTAELKGDGFRLIGIHNPDLTDKEDRERFSAGLARGREFKNIPSPTGTVEIWMQVVRKRVDVN